MNIAPFKFATISNSFKTLFFMILFCLFSLKSWGQTPVNLYGNVWQITFTSGTTNWTVPANTTTMNIYAVGGGGGGGSASGDSYFASGGGGSAAAVLYNYSTFTAGTTSLSITIGSGGSGGVKGSGSDGTNGTDSQVINGATTICLAKGGSKGLRSNSAGVKAGGAGGLATSCVPAAFAYSGGAGGAGGAGSSSGGGGGGGASYTIPGGNATNGTGGIGGLGLFFLGGTGGTGAGAGGFAGNDGLLYGAGGGGSTSNGTGSFDRAAGGKGASGVVVIVYTLNDNRVTIATPGSGTWNVPPGVTSITVECWGAGGGGGAGTGGVGRNGGGGGGGAYTKATITIPSGTTSYNYTIGLGGNSETNGTNTTFGSTLVVSNAGFTGNNSTGTDNGTGGLGGVAGTYNGGNGASGSFSSNYGGGGGASAGNNAVGNNSTSNTGATATSFAGAGGKGGVTEPNGKGNPGSFPGGGGGGGFRSGTVNNVGGKGGDGQIIITYNTSSPLPVTLTNFSANCDNQVSIAWTTASEQNSDRFIVEKSRDLQVWSLVGTQVAAGNSNYVLNYSQTDANAWNGTTYYRLRQIDFNGVEKLYGPISTSCENDNNGMVVYPNPSQGNFTVDITSGEKIQDAEIQVLDVTGKLVSIQMINISEGMNQVYFNQNDLQMGSYFLRLVGGTNSFKPIRLVIE